MKACEAAGSRIGEERGALGAKMKTAAEEKHLDLVAFNMMRALKKRSHAASHLRAFMIYCEYAGIGDQADLEDAIEAANAREDEEETGEETDPISQVIADSEEADLALAGFKTEIAGLAKRKTQLALQEFVAKYPNLAERAEGIAAERHPPANGSSSGAGAGLH